MSLVKYGGGIIQMSGSIAGNTFGRNRYGNYVRAKTKPVNPKTQLQTNVREAIQFLTTYWGNTMTAAQRTAWNLYADSVAMKNKLGEVIKLSGFNHYIRSNVIAYQLDTAYHYTAAPTIFDLPEGDPLFAVTASAATQQLTITFNNALPWANEVNGNMYVYLGRPQNKQINFFNGPWRATGYVTGAAVPPTTPRVMGVNQVITAGQKIFIYARIQRADGRISERFRAECFCAA
jgi:hypothetical protein